MSKVQKPCVFCGEKIYAPVSQPGKSVVCTACKRAGKKITRTRTIYRCTECSSVVSKKCAKDFDGLCAACYAKKAKKEVEKLRKEAARAPVKPVAVYGSGLEFAEPQEAFGGFQWGDVNVNPVG